MPGMLMDWPAIVCPPVERRERLLVAIPEPLLHHRDLVLCETVIRWPSMRMSDATSGLRERGHRECLSVVPNHSCMKRTSAAVWEATSAPTPAPAR
jgi:hypothetical protein